MALVDRACAARCRNLGFLFLQAADAICDFATAFGVG